MTAIGRWAMPSTSRITPPTPVFAPPNGSTADGWLWVSALSAIVVPAVNSMTPALPTNAERTNGASIESVHARSWASSGVTSTGPSGPPVVSIDRPERLVGAVLAPRLGERLDLDVGDLASEALVLVADHAEFLEVEIQGSLDVEGEQAVVVETADRDQLGVGMARRVVEVGRLDDAVAPALDDRVGDHPAHDLVREIGLDARAELDPTGRRGRGQFDAELPGGVHDGVGGSVGHTRKEGDLDAVGCRCIPAGVLQQRVRDRGHESGAVLVVERPRQVDHVGHVDRRRQVDAEVGGRG